jgi:outer membrane receptor for ferrienterochelin and colicins
MNGAEAIAPSSPPDLAEMSFEELASVKVNTVFGASKHEQSVDEAPSSISIVTADEIKKSGYRTLAEVLNGVRGFYITSDRAYTYIGTRGFNRPGDYGGRILITIDGHRMNDAIYDQAANGTEFLLDVDLIERVEVIRGPGSSLYGNNAFFAVINVITKRGRDFEGGELSGSYGRYDTFTGRFSYGSRLTNGLEFILSGSLLDSAGNDRLYYPEFSAVNHGMSENADGSRAYSGFVSLRYGEFTLEGGMVDRTKTLPTGAYGAVFDDPRNTVLDRRAFADFKINHHFENEYELMARAYYDHYDYQGIAPLPEFAYGNPLYPGTVTLNGDHSRQESLGTELQLTRTLFTNHRVTAGVEYRHDFELNQNNQDIGTSTFYLNTNLTADMVGTYIQDEYTVFHNLLLNAGVRYDYFSTFGDSINPRAAVIYNPWTNSTFKFIYGQAFRAPNAYELYYEAPGYTSNPQLKPETIRSYELNYDQRLTHWLQLNTAVFYYQIADLISFGADASGNSVFGNLANATSRGGEIELDAHWAKGWQGRLSYTYADARDAATDTRLSNSPEHLAKLNLTAPLWREKIFGNLELLGMSPRKSIVGGQVGGHVVVNTTIFSRDIIKGVEFSASIYNLLDERYADPVSSDFAQKAISQDGRSFRVKLTYRF